MNLFYQKGIAPDATQIVFDKEESRHIGKVLRKREGDILFITNGEGIVFEAKLEVVNPKSCVSNVIGVEKQPSIPYHLHLAVAPTKLNDRYEWFLEKATEIGVSEITPIICDHSERKVIKPERYEKILQSAMKQSLSAYLPKLNEAMKFSEFLETKQQFEGNTYIAHCEEIKKQSLKSLLQPKQHLLICIGPEGDFSPQEINLAQENGFISVTLGETRLRTETAAIVACHSVAFVNEV